MSDKNILIVSTIWGHASIARGIRDSLKGSGHKVRMEIIKVDSFTEKSYKAFYRFLPWLFTATFQVSKSDAANKVLDKFFEKNYFRKIEAIIKKTKPDIVINAYFAFDSSLEKLIKRYKFKYINAFSDPWTFSKIHIARKGLNLVFDAHALNRIKEIDPDSNSVATGWFVEKKYYEGDKVAARKIISIDPKKFTMCVTGGSEGTYDILKFAGSLVKTGKSLQILFMCGDNRQLYELAMKLAELLSKTTKVRLFPYKFTRDMDLFIQASDLVVGKAGPNTIFECVASNVPFFAITHVSGQEDGNLDLIKRYKIGLVEENSILAVRKIKAIIKKPSVLKKFQKPIRALSKYNQSSRMRLLELLKD